MVFNATFNNISVILWRRKTDYPEKTNELPQVTDKLYRIMLYWVHLASAGFELTTLVAIGIDCIGSKSNYHTITTMMGPFKNLLTHHNNMNYSAVKPLTSKHRNLCGKDGDMGKGFQISTHWPVKQIFPKINKIWKSIRLLRYFSISVSKI
jgi:hypothetical protein